MTFGFEKSKKIVVLNMDYSHAGILKVIETNSLLSAILHDQE